MKKVLFILALIMPLILSAQPGIINLDGLDPAWQSIDIDTLYFSEDSTYITGAGDTIKLVVDDIEALRLFNNAGTTQALLPDGTAAKPTVGFINSPTTGLFALASNYVSVSISGTNTFNFSSTAFKGLEASGPQMLNRASTSTSPTFNSNRADDDTGLGSAGLDSLSIIAGGVEGIRIAEGGDNIAVQINGSNNYAADAQDDDDYEIDIGAITQLTEGMTVTFKANTANTDGATLEITNVGDLDDILKMNDQALVTGDIEAGQIVVCVFDGTNWQMTSQLAQ